MDLYAFNQKEMKERAQFVWERGFFLATRYEKDQPVELYYMGSFFAEVWYKDHFHPVPFIGFFFKQEHLAFVRAFNHQDCLGPYLELIQLPEF